MKVIVRFPPSPTGPFHVGGVRTALYNYLFAKKNDGKFLLRIEDTDKERSKKEFETDIFDSLAWLGLEHDNKGEEWRQSERTEIYKEKIQELIKKGSAYLAEEQNPSTSSGQLGENKQVVRFKNPGGKIKFQDLIRGEVEMDVGDLKDFIIAKNIEEPLYHLTVVVDDLSAEVTHVIRGEDHISNTPRQILLLEALGGERPIYAHLPLILAPDKSKLSKRKHGESVSLKYYREQGYEKEAILNFMALLGWNPGETEQEIFSMNELIEKFDISKVQKKGAIFNTEKLDWMNKEYISLLSPEQKMANFMAQIEKTKLSKNPKFEDNIFTEKILNLSLEKTHKWKDVYALVGAGELDCFFEAPEIEVSKIIWKSQTIENAKENLEKVLKILEENKTENIEKVKEEIMSIADKEGRGEVLWPFRYSLSGKEKSTDPFTIINIIGTPESTKRIKKVLEQ